MNAPAMTPVNTSAVFSALHATIENLRSFSVIAGIVLSHHQFTSLEEDEKRKTLFKLLDQQLGNPQLTLLLTSEQLIFSFSLLNTLANDSVYRKHETLHETLIERLCTFACALFAHANPQQELMSCSEQIKWHPQINNQTLEKELQF